MDDTAIPRPDWGRIDTVLLDLDGTLLDLAYDNHVWMECVPAEFAAARGLTLDAARAALAPRFRSLHGRMEWYDIDFWSRELGLDILAMHRREIGRIGWLPGAREFLRTMRERGKRLVLLTNSHPATLAIKDEVAGLAARLDAIVSSHRFGCPKEDARFWERVQEVERFEPSRSLFADDSSAVLAAARAAGIGWIYAVRHADTTAPPREHEDFPSIHGVGELVGN
jgi:putative hydrolase of the HAD superfamily